MNISFELYKIFYHAATSDSFSEAARKMFITQSAVSQSIKNLETQLGSQLFFRKGRRVKLTWQGEQLFKYVQQAYHLFKAAEGKFFELQNPDKGEIRIGASDTVCKYHLIPFLERFSNEHPMVKIQMVNRTSSQILELLKNGHIDFGIVTLPVMEKQFSVKKFISVEDIFISSNRFPELRETKIPLDRLSQYPLLLLDKKSMSRLHIDNFFEKNGITVTPEIELESVDLLVEFSRIGLGIACVLKESALEWIHKELIFEINIDKKLPLRELGICTLRDMPISRAAIKFIEFLENKNI